VDCISGKVAELTFADRLAATDPGPGPELLQAHVKIVTITTRIGQTTHKDKRIPQVMCVHTITGRWIRLSIVSSIVDAGRVQSGKTFELFLVASPQAGFLTFIRWAPARWNRICNPNIHLCRLGQGENPRVLGPVCVWQVSHRRQLLVMGSTLGIVMVVVLVDDACNFARWFSWALPRGER
jgi:hypothetical protein